MRRLLALLCLAAIAWPQELTEPPGHEPKDPEPPAKPELHKIYVPYEKLDEVLGTDKERVMVPYKEFLELWNLKYGRKTPGTSLRSPMRSRLPPTTAA